MPLRSSHRRLIALATALIVMLCPLASTAHVYAHSVEAARMVAMPPCHETSDGTRDAPPSPEQASLCSATAMMADDVSIALLSITDLPALFVASAPTMSVALLSPYRRTVQTLYHPPPLNVVFCRFLN